LRSITPRDLKSRLDRGEPLALVDVREPDEHALCAIPGSRLIPMDEIPRRMGEIDPDVETVVVCHHGIRSAHVIAHLESRGFRNLVNLRGGIDAWALEVVPTMRTY
jgi:rhodanese-related sulfurtransferase